MRVNISQATILDSGHHPTHGLAYSAKSGYALFIYLIDLPLFFVPLMSSTPVNRLIVGSDVETSQAGIAPIPEAQAQWGGDDRMTQSEDSAGGQGPGPRGAA